ncbi:MAG: PLP-dependent aminotransferase family protein [Dehalococcoidia bacterium]|uniref:aminotransferase-like domain-containing protein n=1 Tax=Pseudonocardia sp. TaxID=60912 RepID=UPI003D0CDA60
MRGGQLDTALLGDWLRADGPLYLKLASALRAAVERGDIPAGTRLPPERTLAQSLQVSRATVVSAYKVLRAEGWLLSRQGSGHVVSHRTQDDARPLLDKELVEGQALNPLMRRHDPGDRGLVDFTASQQSSLGSFLREETTASGDELQALAADAGYQPSGLENLREGVARYLTSQFDLPTTLDQILITSGAQQAIWLTGQLYARHGDNVVLENPTYSGAIDAYRMIGARLSPVPVTADGFDIQALTSLLPALRPRVVFLSPTCHAPTGAVMPEEQRMALIDLVDEHQITTIEDQTMLPLLVDPVAPPPLAALSGSAPVLSVGSLSKIMWPGLRTGWVRAPLPVIEQLTRIKAATDLGGSLVGQHIAARLLGRAEEIRRLRCAQVAESLDVMCECLTRMLPDWTWSRPAGGLSIWIRLPTHGAVEFTQLALLHGVKIVPGPSLSFDGSNDDYIRLQFVQPPELVDLGVRRLAQAWRSYAS